LAVWISPFIFAALHHFYRSLDQGGRGITV